MPRAHWPLGLAGPGPGCDCGSPVSVPERAPVAGRGGPPGWQPQVGLLAARDRAGSPAPRAPRAQDAPRGLGAGALLRAPLLPLAQVFARHLLHSVLGE